jgi:hypothetical protein
MRNYLKTKYKALEEYQLCQLINICKLISVKEFLIFESSFSSMNVDQIATNKSEKSKGVSLIKYLKNEVMTPEQQSELKLVIKNERKVKKNEKEPYYIFFHDSGRILSKDEYESLVKNII